MVLTGRSAVITGASSGVGHAIALSMAAAGASVAINYHSHADEAETLAARIRGGGGKALAIKADVSQEDEVAGLFRQAVQAFGRVDILVANSGLQKDASIADMSLADWRAVIDVDLTGQFLCCREAVKCFRAQDPTVRPARAAGSIICMSSVHQQIPWAGHINYAASKGGVLMLMKTLAQEVACERIRVNAIAPGAIRTPINKEVWGDPAAMEKLLQLIPYGRIGEPDDVARAAVWLAGDDADYVTGTTLFIDGGMSLYPEFRANG